MLDFNIGDDWKASFQLIEGDAAGFETRTLRACACFILENKTTGSLYVAHTANLHKTLNNYMNQLWEGVHGNEQLQHDFNRDPDLAVWVRRVRDLHEAPELASYMLGRLWATKKLCNVRKQAQVVDEACRELRGQAKRRFYQTAEGRRVLDKLVVQTHHRQRKPVMAYGQQYESISAAAAALNLTRGGLSKQLHSPNHPEVYFIDHPSKTTTA